MCEKIPMIKEIASFVVQGTEKFVPPKSADKKLTADHKVRALRAPR
jgi:hypothetical protein